MKKHLFKIKPLLPFYVIHGEKEEDGMISEVIYLTRQHKYHTAFADMTDKGMDNGELPAYIIEKGTKAIVITGVLFPQHTQRIKKIISQEKFFFFAPGSKIQQSINRPPILITTCSPIDKIPLTMFPGTVGVLNCI